MYDEYAKSKSIWLFELEDQHGDERMFKGPLKVLAKLELPCPDKCSKATLEKLSGEYSTTAPTLGEIASLIGRLGTGILFNTDVIIVTMSLEKTYAQEPCTYLTISEV